jgi:hypothetical protein
MEDCGKILATTNTPIATSITTAVIISSELTFLFIAAIPHAVIRLCTLYSIPHIIMKKGLSGQLSHQKSPVIYGISI